MCCSVVGGGVCRCVCEKASRCVVQEEEMVGKERVW